MSYSTLSTSHQGTPHPRPTLMQKHNNVSRGGYLEEKHNNESIIIAKLKCQEHNNEDYYGQWLRSPIKGTVECVW